MLSLLAIVFFLMAAMVYMVCNKRVTPQSSAGNQDSSPSPPPTWAFLGRLSAPWAVREESARMDLALMLINA